LPRLIYVFNLNLYTDDHFIVPIRDIVNILSTKYNNSFSSFRALKAPIVLKEGRKTGQNGLDCRSTFTTILKPDHGKNRLTNTALINSLVH
jgi:hypothetical protein